MVTGPASVAVWLAAFARVAAILPFDELSPTIVSSPGTLGLDSIGNIRVAPSASGEKPTFVQDQNDRLHVYNPSIVALEPADRQRLNATYVAMIRASNHNNCMRLPTVTPTTHVEFTGFALLDADLKRVPGREVVVRTPEEDCRMKARGGSLLFWCKQHVMIVQLSLTGDPSVRQNCTGNLTCLGEGGARGGEVGSGNAGFEVISEQGLQVALVAGCMIDVEGKNFNFFEAGNRTYVEVWPLTPGENPTFMQRLHHTGSAKARHDVLTVPADLFPCGQREGDREKTEEGIAMPKFVGEPRGGTCCITLPGAPGMLIGIGHSKIWRMQYTNFLYAFESKPPFKVKGLSNPFCWPDFDESSLSNDTLLNIDGTLYACSHIQMTMSLTPNAHDADKLIVGYGLNDCVARYAQVSKKSILEKINWI